MIASFNEYIQRHYNQHYTYITPKVSLCSFVILPFLPFLHSPGNHWSKFCHYSLQFLELNKWNHRVCAFCLTLFTQHNSFKIHPYFIYGLFFLLLSSILFMDITQSIYPFNCWWTFGLFLVFLAITNKTTMNIHIQVPD